jgi:hypothetical protein
MITAIQMESWAEVSHIVVGIVSIECDPLMVCSSKPRWAGRRPGDRLRALHSLEGREDIADYLGPYGWNSQSDLLQSSSRKAWSVCPTRRRYVDHIGRPITLAAGPDRDRDSTRATSRSSRRTRSRPSPAWATGAQSSPSGSPLLARLISSSSTHRHEGCEAPPGAITRKATRTKTLLGTAGLFCAALELHQKEEMSKRVRDEIKLAVTTLMVIGLWLTQLWVIWDGTAKDGLGGADAGHLCLAAEAELLAEIADRVWHQSLDGRVAPGRRQTEKNFPKIVFPQRELAELDLTSGNRASSILHLRSWRQSEFQSV